MKIYVESNFVLEHALLQEQHASCESMIRLAEASKVNLIIPAYSPLEPYETMIRRHRSRREIKSKLDVELGHIARTVVYSDKLNGFRDITLLLLESIGAETQRLEETRSRLLQVSTVIPIDQSTLNAAALHAHRHRLSPQDAQVYSAVISHLIQSEEIESCFLNRNSRDFDDPGIQKELSKHNCKLFAQFDLGYRYVTSRLA